MDSVRVSPGPDDLPTVFVFRVPHHVFVYHHRTRSDDLLDAARAVAGHPLHRAWVVQCMRQLASAREPSSPPGPIN
jgi:hypothetical protein